MSCDLKYLGQSEISIEYRTYLGFIRTIDKINGEPYMREERIFTDIDAGHPQGLRLSGFLNRASYKVLEEYPEASYFILVSKSRHKTRLFLGGEVTEKAIIKAYAFE